jgi:hypothetical protein
VRAFNQNVQSAWSDIYLFSTEDKPSPEVPVLAKPKTGGVSSIRPIFEWNVCDNAIQYELLVSKNDDFSDWVIDKSGENSCNSNVWVLDKDLEYNTNYYWMVRAKSEDKISKWSAVSLFTTEAAPKATPTKAAPPTPSLIATTSPKSTSSTSPSTSAAPSKVSVTPSTSNDNLTQAPAKTSAPQNTMASGNADSTKPWLWVLGGAVAILLTATVVMLCLLLKKSK